MANYQWVGACLGLAWLTLTAAVPATPAATPWTIDAGKSRVVIEVGKAGMLGFAGHAHEIVAPAVRGAVALDETDWRQSTVTLEFDATALRVSGEGEPPADVPQVQQVMLSNRVLDVARFATVSFKSRRISIVGGRIGAADLQIDGDVTLHGVTRPLSVRARAALDGSGALVTRGDFSIKQTDFGIEPVTAAAGSIRVKDAVGVQFVLVAHR
ncbi:MAG: YceI family protein [Bacteroidales bacterium]